MAIRRSFYVSLSALLAVGAAVTGPNRITHTPRPTASISLPSAHSSLMDAVRQKLVETGQYQQLQNEVKQQLIQSGWYDQVNALAVREVSLAEAPNLEVLTAKLEQQALAMIPEEIRANLLAKVQAKVQANTQAR